MTKPAPAANKLTPTRMKLTATRLAFVLGMLCLGIIGYSTIAYIHLTFGSSSESVPLTIVRQRTALSAISTVTAISCIIMGFAVFMIGAKGEIKVESDNSWLKGTMMAAVPGPFFVLCGTVIAVAVLNNKVTHEEIGSSPVPAAPQDAASATPTAPRPADPGKATAVTSRTVASPDRLEVIFTKNNLLFATLKELREGEVKPDLAQRLSEVLVGDETYAAASLDWDYAKESPRDNALKDLHTPAYSYDLSGGWVIVPPSGSGFVGLLDAIRTVCRYGGTDRREGDRVAWQKMVPVLQESLRTCIFFDLGEKQTPSKLSVKR
jgi:hypothetical protein